MTSGAPGTGFYETTYPQEPWFILCRRKTGDPLAHDALWRVESLYNSCFRYIYIYVFFLNHTPEWWRQFESAKSSIHSFCWWVPLATKFERRCASFRNVLMYIICNVSKDDLVSLSSVLPNQRHPAVSLANVSIRKWRRLQLCRCYWPASALTPPPPAHLKHHHYRLGLIVSICFMS